MEVWQSERGTRTPNAKNQHEILSCTPDRQLSSVLPISQRRRAGFGGAAEHRSGGCPSRKRQPGPEWSAQERRTAGGCGSGDALAAGGHFAGRGQYRRRRVHDGLRRCAAEPVCVEYRGRAAGRTATMFAKDATTRPPCGRRARHGCAGWSSPMRGSASSIGKSCPRPAIDWRAKFRLTRGRPLAQPLLDSSKQFADSKCACSPRQWRPVETAATSSYSRISRARSNFGERPRFLLPRAGSPTPSCQMQAGGGLIPRTTGAIPAKLPTRQADPRNLPRLRYLWPAATQFRRHVLVEMLMCWSHWSSAARPLVA